MVFCDIEVLCFESSVSFEYIFVDEGFHMILLSLFESAYVEFCVVYVAFIDGCFGYVCLNVLVKREV